MKSSQVCLDLIERREGFRAHAYADPASPLYRMTSREPWGFKPSLMILSGLSPTVTVLSGKPWTIGIGTTRYPNGNEVYPGDFCTIEEARQWLALHVEEDEILLNNALSEMGIVVNQPMFDALMSLLYNIGPGIRGKKDGLLWLKSGRRSTLLTRLSDRDFAGAAAEFVKWNRAGGQEMDGLTDRRKEERDLFQSGIDMALAFAKEQGWLA